MTHVRSAPSNVHVTAPGEGELIGDAPDRRVEILCEDDALHATWTRFGPGRDGASPHVHRHHTDLFFVLRGELTVTLGPGFEERSVPAGHLVRVPPMVIHGFRNARAAELRYLNFHAPGQGFADYLRGLRDHQPVEDFDQWDPPADGGRPVSEASIAPLDRPVEAGGLTFALLRLDAGWHASLTQGWAYVVDGEVTADGREITAGSWIAIPRGGVNSVTPGAGASGRVLTISLPV